MLLLFLGYHLEVTKRTLAEAKAFCNNLGQKLFEPKSLEANSEVNKLAKPHVLTGPYGIISIWIGIQDKISEGIQCFTLMILQKIEIKMFYY